MSLEDLDELQDAVLDVHFDRAGVPIVITRPETDALPVATSGMWIASLDEARPIGTDLIRREPRRTLVVKRASGIPELVRGTQIVAAEKRGGQTRTWRVDSLEQPTEPDLVRVALVLIPTP